MALFMRILAIFDCSDIEARIQLLRKNRHVVTHVTNIVDGLALLKSKSFDLILCQATFEVNTANVFDLLKEIREISDVPFICCSAGKTKMESAVENPFLTTLPLLGGQGFIDNDTFCSPRFAQVVERSTQAAVGGKCTVGSLYGKSDDTERND